MIQGFKEKIPSLQLLAPVYGVIVLFVYSWTILWFFWKLNGWLVYLNLGEIGIVLAYSMSINLLESLVVLIFPVILSILLPAKWYFDQFVARSTALLIPALSFLIFSAYQFEGRSKFHQSLIVKSAIPTFIIMLIIVLSTGKWGGVRRIFEITADRASVFIYISLPLSLVSLVIVIARNLF